jgi:hypothetical protein
MLVAATSSEVRIYMFAGRSYQETSPDEVQWLEWRGRDGSFAFCDEFADWDLLKVRGYLD